MIVPPAEALRQKRIERHTTSPAQIGQDGMNVNIIQAWRIAPAASQCGWRGRGGWVGMTVASAWMTMRLWAVAAVIAVMLPGVVTGQSPGRDEHKELHWSGAGGCVVDFANTPCRTVRYHKYFFGSGLGFDRTTRSEAVEATDQDGSESKTTTSVWHRWWFLPERTWKFTELLLRAADRVVYIDHEHKIYETHPGAAKRPVPYWEEDDAQCSHTASHSLYLSGRLPDSIVAGVHVVGYRGRDFRGVDYEVYFAPSIGCQDMRFHMVKRGLFGWITAEYDMVVDSYVLGPPARSLFAIPSGYKQVPSILQFQSEQPRMR
jgi:hypothetical protein